MPDDQKRNLFTNYLTSDYLPSEKRQKYKDIWQNKYWLKNLMH